jgi:hypothetical protein
MRLSIDGAHVLFRAIESVYFDADFCELVVRTVSGKEHRMKVRDRADFDSIAKKIIQRIALCESI